MRSTPLYAPDGLTSAGGDPERFGTSIEEFHSQNAERLAPAIGRAAKLFGSKRRWSGVRNRRGSRLCRSGCQHDLLRGDSWHGDATR